MSNSFNVIGTLGADAEVRSAGGSPVCSFRIAEKQGWGEKAQTVWYRCDLWGKRGESIAQYLLKGGKVWVSGELQMDEYQGKPQYNVRADRVEFMSSRQDGASPARQSSPATQPDYDDGSDIPF